MQADNTRQSFNLLNPVPLSERHMKALEAAIDAGRPWAQVAKDSPDLALRFLEQAMDAGKDALVARALCADLIWDNPDDKGLSVTTHILGYALPLDMPLQQYTEYSEGKARRALRLVERLGQDLQAEVLARDEMVADFVSCGLDSRVWNLIEAQPAPAKARIYAAARAIASLMETEEDAYGRGAYGRKIAAFLTTQAGTEEQTRILCAKDAQMALSLGNYIPEVAGIVLNNLNLEQQRRVIDSDYSLNDDGSVKERGWCLRRAGFGMLVDQIESAAAPQTGVRPRRRLNPRLN